MTSTEFTHRAASESLAAQMDARQGFMAWVEVPLGSVTGNPHTQRADVWSITQSYNTGVAIYEVKVARSDYEHDLATAKWRGYLEHCHRLYFALASPDIAKRNEVPPEAGLIVWNGNHWAVKRAAPTHPNTGVPSLTQLLRVLWNIKAERPTVRNLRERLRLEENEKYRIQAVRLGADVRAKIEFAERISETWAKTVAEIEVLLGRKCENPLEAVRALAEHLHSIGLVPERVAIGNVLARAAMSMFSDHGVAVWDIDQAQDALDKLRAVLKAGQRT